MKFTPGPWKVRQQNIWNPDIKYGDIAHVYCKESSLIRDFEKDEIAKANAALISAAPELLDALKFALEQLIDPNRGPSGTKFAQEKARAAIARAEGREP